MNNWRPGIITARCTDGDHALPGWISEPFGIDWGVNRDTGKILWIVHHLPTGYSLIAVDHEIDQVMQLVDLLRSLGDWNFTDPARSADYRDALKIVRAEGFTVVSPARIGRPTYPDQLAEFA